MENENLGADSIEMRIADTAAQKWGQDRPQNLQEAKRITDGSEISAVKGIISSLGLEPHHKEEMMNDIYYETEINYFSAEEIKKAIGTDSKNKSILEILSTIHDDWVRTHADNFKKINADGKPRNKERQFVPLQLLDWGEVESDLLFLKPILESAGVEVDEEQLKKDFEIQQQEYMIENRIFSHEDLVAHLSKGAKFYQALDGLETVNGGNIEALLQNSEIAESMAKQIESRIAIKSREDLAKDILKSNNPSLDEVLWVQTVERDAHFNEEKCPFLNGPISRREILLSKLIGKPYPTYLLEGITDHNHDEYRNALRRPSAGEWDIVDRYADNIASRKIEAMNMNDTNLDKYGRVEFGYNESGEKMQGAIEVSTRDLLSGGLTPEQMELSLNKFKEITPEDIATNLDKPQALTTSEIGGIKGFIKKMLDKIRGKGEK